MNLFEYYNVLNFTLKMPGSCLVAWSLTLLFGVVNITSIIDGGDNQEEDKSPRSPPPPYPGKISVSRPVQLATPFVWTDAIVVDASIM